MDFEILLVALFAMAGLGIVIFSVAGKTRKIVQSPSGSRVHETQPEFQPFKQKIAEEPHEPRHWLQWGHALVLSARNGESLHMKLHRYNEACSCYRQATGLAPAFVPAWTSWGITLYELFRTQKCSDIFLLEGGHNKFQTALDLSPRAAKLWVQWGTELRNLSAVAGTDQRNNLMSMAEECFSRAAELDAKGMEDTEPPLPVVAPANRTNPADGPEPATSAEPAPAAAGPVATAMAAVPPVAVDGPETPS